MSVHPIGPPGAGRRYEVRWREGQRQRAKRFRMRVDADAWDREVERRRQLGPLAVRQLTVKGPTLGAWIADRWSPEHAVNLEAKTRHRYANSYEVHIEPWLGHLRLQDLTVGRLRQWQADRLRAGVSPHALMKARTVLSSVLRHAAESEAIQANPIQLVRPPRAPHADQVTPLSPRQVERLRRLLRPRDATIVSVLAYSGIRPGELRALRWGDIGRNTILVQRAADPAGQAKRTKTRRGVRNVRLLPALAQDLAAWRERSGGRGSRLVFPSQSGGPMTEAAWNDWRSHVWRPTRGLVVDFDPRPYDLRHSFASLLLAEGRSVHYVAEQLGHDAALTLSTYGHLIAEYADSGNIDVDHEIQAARDEAAAWVPPAASPPRLGARQALVLDRLAAAGSTGVTFAGRRADWNDRRCALALADRGLAATADGRHFTITDGGLAAMESR